MSSVTLKNLAKTHLFITVLLCIFFFAVSSYGNNTVSGRYYSSTGKTITLQITVTSSTPTNIIVEQYIEPGNKILSASPKPKKLDNSRGKVKWLLRNFHSGAEVLSLKLEKPSKGHIKSVIRYRNPHGGQFTELTVNP